MTVSLPDGPPPEACHVCGEPCPLHTAPYCAACAEMKPGDRVKACMERMLTSAAGRNRT